MNPPPAALSKDESNAPRPIRSIELGPARKRERLVQQVRAASKRLPQTPPSTLARSR
jgi:hypothetical protein